MEMGHASSVRTSRGGLVSWCLYDWANSAFPTVITTFVFAAYFTQAVAPSPETGTALWGEAMALAGLIIALASPALGAIADQGGRRKPWLAAFTGLCVVATASLWWVAPQPGAVPLALLALVLGTVGVELASVFYNAMLPDLVTKGRYGRLSGWGWGIGYAGGLACLVVALFGLVQAEPPPFGLQKADAEHVRATAPLVALWFAVFALPLFLFTPDTPCTGMPAGQAVRRGLASLMATLRGVRRHRQIVRFLVARIFYIDGLNTLFAFGGIYAAGTFGMDIAEIIRFGIAMNVTAGLGAFAFGWFDDRVGPKATIVVSLLGLVLLGGGLLVVETKAWFWTLGLPLGLFVGPAQSASRSLMAHLAPEELRTEMFGLFALSGKITAFAGPAILGWVTVVSGSQRWGMATILISLVIGLAILLPVKADVK
ncbi:MAG: MFS transporter [Alphaproteobacteria bacterium]|nr:MFS transporter [Alphaproteobacteria bacterium]